MRVLISAGFVMLFVLSFQNPDTSTVISPHPTATTVPPGPGAAPYVAFANAGDIDAVYALFQGSYASGRAPEARRAPEPGQEAHEDPTPEELTTVVRQYCVACHNDRMMTADLTLQNFDVDSPTEQPVTAEKVISKLRLEMMPPPGIPRPAGDTLLVLASTLERRMDEAAALTPNPGSRSFQRLNQAEYARAVYDLLGVEVDAGSYLPMDTKSDNFDNISDVQLLSPTLLDAYLRAAAGVSRMALGDPDASAQEVTYSLPRSASQREHVEGAPYGTRGGLSELHHFPADGDYVFRVSFFLSTHGGFVGASARGEQLEISIDGERVALLDVDRFIRESDPNTTLSTDPIAVRAGPRRVSAAFIPTSEASHQYLIPLHDWSLSSLGQTGQFGVGEIPHLRDLVIGGPHNVTGVSETPVRQRLFTCRPESPAEARPCAQEIASRLASQAFRLSGTLPDKELDGLMALYDFGESEGGFEAGIRTVLEGILASPDFVFRVERAGSAAEDGGAYQINGQELATRLSFFLWATLPDEELLTLARQERLAEPEVLEAQVRRMLADPRSEALATRFAAQWLRLPDLAGIQPNASLYPDFDEQLRASMKRETELLFDHIVREDRGVLELWDADYTFVNERLARHYRIPGIAGTQFRRVEVTDEHRRGLLGHSSILTLTSHASRTSPTDRGKWVMEVFLNSPPPPPPPGVPELEATSGVADGESRFLTVRERMEVHRANPACASCHVMIDPIGLALENYDVTGRWRIRDNWMPIDSRSELWDGTPMEKPADLRRALLDRPIPLLQTFTRNLMAYAIGRRIEAFDMPTIRDIVRQAEANEHRISSYILGVVSSPAFQMRSTGMLAAVDNED